MTLQQAVFAGSVDPGNLVGRPGDRSRPTSAPDCGAAAPVNCDTAVFTVLDHAYAITPNSERQRDGRQQGRRRRHRHAVEHREAAVRRHDHRRAHRNGRNAPPVGTVTLSNTTPTEGIAPDRHAGVHGRRRRQPAHPRPRPGRSKLSPGRVGRRTATVGPTFTPGNLEVGLRLRVDATFLDNAGDPRGGHLGSDGSRHQRQPAARWGAPGSDRPDADRGRSSSRRRPRRSPIADGLTGVHLQLPVAAERKRRRRRIRQHRRRTELGELHAGPGAGQPRPPGRRDLHRPPRHARNGHVAGHRASSPVTSSSAAAGADTFNGTAGEDHAFGRGGNDTLNGDERERHHRR